ncbi:DUF1440 domain-containing protein [Sphingomonas sp.]|uniref:DUF1440 domain-containing protein n=1 Tax=Sphingomonas sp. TaxID=28214 RepID=UPI0031DB6B94
MADERRSLGLAIGVGVIGGLLASLAMNQFQAVAAGAFGQKGSNDDPATVKAADVLAKVTTGEPVTQKYRETAGSMVHYATGAALGGLYGALTHKRPQAALGLGLPFGLATMLVVDDLAVPAFGLGAAPQDTPPATHGYSAASHAVFGVVLEGVRRLVLRLA